MLKGTITVGRLFSGRILSKKLYQKLFSKCVVQTAAIESKLHEAEELADKYNRERELSLSRRSILASINKNFCEHRFQETRMYQEDDGSGHSRYIYRQKVICIDCRKVISE